MRGEVETLVKELRKEGYFASMIMIGESVFVLGTEKDLKTCEQFVKDSYPKATTWINELAETGPRKEPASLDIKQYLTGD